MTVKELRAKLVALSPDMDDFEVVCVDDAEGYTFNLSEGFTIEADDRRISIDVEQASDDDSD